MKPQAAQTSIASTICHELKIVCDRLQSYEETLENLLDTLDCDLNTPSEMALEGE